MSGSDVDHISCLPDSAGPHRARRQSSQSSSEFFYDAPLGHPVNHAPLMMPGSTTAAALPHAPLRSTTLPLAGMPEANGRTSPDPHEYYRQHKPSATAGSSGASTAHPPQFQRVASLPSYNAINSSGRIHGHQNRSASDTPKTVSNQASTARSRQVSFKDLINKFENSNDQVLPAPSQIQERSRLVSPPGSPTSTSRSRLVAQGNLTEPPGPNSPTGPVASPVGADGDTSGKHVVKSNNVPRPPPVPSRRPLRFEERLSVDTTGAQGRGSAIPAHMNRRGSEGSIPSPGPRTLNDQLERSPGLSPLTPTAWYLGKTQSLEAVDPSADASNYHRRTRSDFPKNNSAQSSSHLAVPIPAPLHQELQPQPQPQSQSQLQQSRPSTPPENPHSKSRIPISSRHLNSDLGRNTSPKASSATFRSRSAAQIPLPPKGISRLPKPSSSPETTPGMTDDESPQTSMRVSAGSREKPTMGRVRQQRSGRSPQMRAYIAAPPPQKSAPPLRSSRPRKPVSNATTPTGPRSRVGETVSNFQRQINRDPRGSRRERRLPELGHVDFATRRQRIQQAFNRTVKENERKEEEAAENRRQVQTEDENRVNHPPIQTEQSSQQQGTVGKVPSPPPAEDAATVIEDQDETCDDEQLPPPPTPLQENNNKSTSDSSEHSRPIPQLHLQTDIPALPELPGTSSAHQATMDSPTLGALGVTNKDTFTQRFDPNSAPGPPTSAVTLGSTDTHVTALDPEPQSGIDGPRPEPSHQSLLSHIVHTRRSSPSSSSCDEPDFSPSDNDDKESIPIMFGANTRVDDSVDGSENHDTHESCDDDSPREHTGDEPPSNRWSTSSWSSSLRDQHFVEAQYDDCSGEDFSHLAPSAADDSEAATQSCSASSSTPPSIVGHQFTVTPPQADLGREPKNEASTSNRDSSGPSNAPSLARLGGWDSRRVTQLYFEELARGRSNSLSVPPVRASPEPRRSEPEQKTDGRPDSLTDDPVVVPSFEETPGIDKARNSASLVFRDDWEHASPSIADWMQVAADDDSTGSSSRGKVATTGPNRDDAPTPRLDAPRPGESQGALGLAINVQAPQDFDSSSMAPSEATPKDTTTKQPPPPPSQAPSDISPDQLEQPQQQATHHTITQAPVFSPLRLVDSIASSDSSSLQRLGPIPSQAQAVASSVTSLAPSHSDPADFEIKRPSPSPEQRRLKKRRHVIKELVDTEYNFGRDMKVVDDIYKGTSSSCLDLSTDDVKILFGNSELVVQFSMAFQDALKNAAKSIYVMPKSQRWTSRRARNRQMNASYEDQASIAGMEALEFEKDRATFIGETFLVHVTQMEKVYADYLKNHDSANKKLQALQRNPKVAIWLKECRDWAADLTTAWDLDSLLVKPVQRILKYPLLLTELLDSTPQDHPDHASLINALEEVTNISIRINEMKKRADLVGQVVGRKRNQSDVRAGLSKAFGRRTEKFRQNVGVADLFEDKVYDELSQLFGDRYVQVQLVMRDVDLYIQGVHGFVNQLNDFILGVEAFIDVAQSNYAELETKWRQLKITTQDIVAAALPDHLSAVKKNVTDWMITLLRFYEGPQRVMRKRDKRLMDYARSKTAKDRGEKVDKKTLEQAEQFMALNETLKDELPKLYGLTAKFMDACLKNYVQVVTPWLDSLQRRLAPFADTFPDDYEKIYNEWASDFTFSDAQVLSLGICNGTMLAETSSHDTASGRPSTVNSSSTWVGSNLEESPKISYDSKAGSNQFQLPAIESHPHMSGGRRRTDSAVSGPGARSIPEASPEMQSGPVLQKITSSTTATSVPPSSTNTTSEPFPSLPQLSLDTPLLSEIISTSASENPPATPAGRYSGFFSSAMPMSDNPDDTGGAGEAGANGSPKQPKVLFLAASIYEFNIDRARREAGYPYLTYVAGEIFDVIAEKGELWLARNQDDPTRQVGWIWNKHFAKLSG